MQTSVPVTLGNLQRKRQFALVAVSLAFMAALFTIQPVYDRSWYDVLCKAAGIALILCGFGIRLWCTLYIGGRKNKVLLTDGPYSLCRNPLYVGSILAAFGIGLQAEMASFGILLGLACWAVFHVVVRREEAFLLAEFGPVYRHYMSVTPRFLPRFPAYRDRLTEHSFQPAMLWNTFRDGLVLFAIIPLTEAIELAHRAGVLHAAFRWY